MKCFIEKNNGIWLEDFCYISVSPASSAGYEIVPYEKYNFTKNIVDSDNDIIIGSIQALRKWFDIYHDFDLTYETYPELLRGFLKRNVQKITVGDLKESMLPLFIKPIETKLFTGDVFTNKNQLNILKQYYEDVDESTQIWVSDLVDIVSEWRCFVSSDKVVGISYYSGDFFVYPDKAIILNIVETYHNSPISYSIDVGVTKEGKTILIESNDFWSLGSYGLEGKIYFESYLKRFKEITLNCSKR